jgi:hypothetical protein
MDPILVMVAHVLVQEATQMLFVPGNDPIQELAADAPHPALRDAILPRGLHTRALRFQTSRLEEREDFAMEFRVRIENHVPVGIRFRKSLSQLLHDPGGTRMTGDMEVQDPAPLVFDHEGTVKNLKSQGGHGKEIHRHDRLAVVGQKSQPVSLRIAAAS